MKQTDNAWRWLDQNDDTWLPEWHAKWTGAAFGCAVLDTELSKMRNDVLDGKIRGCEVPKRYICEYSKRFNSIYVSQTYLKMISIAC